MSKKQISESPSRLKKRILPRNRFVRNKKMHSGKENGFKMGICVDAELNRHYSGNMHSKQMSTFIDNVNKTKIYPYGHMTYKNYIVKFISSKFPKYNIQTQKTIDCNVNNACKLKTRVDFYGQYQDSKICIEEKFTAIPKGPQFTAYFSKLLKGKFATGTKAEGLMPNTVKTDWDIQAAVPSLVGITCYLLIIHVNLQITFYQVKISPRIYKMLYCKEVLQKCPITKNVPAGSKTRKKTKTKPRKSIKTKATGRKNKKW